MRFPCKYNHQQSLIKAYSSMGRCLMQKPQSRPLSDYRPPRTLSYRCFAQRFGQKMVWFFENGRKYDEIDFESIKIISLLLCHHLAQLFPIFAAKLPLNGCKIYD